MTHFDNPEVDPRLDHATFALYMEEACGIDLAGMDESEVYAAGRRASQALVAAVLATDAAADLKREAIDDGIRRRASCAAVADLYIVSLINSALATWRAGRR